MFTWPKGKRVIKWMQAPDQMFYRYDNYGKQAEAIVKAIEKAYPELAEL